MLLQATNCELHYILFCECCGRCRFQSYDCVIICFME